MEKGVEEGCLVGNRGTWRQIGGCDVVSLSLLGAQGMGGRKRFLQGDVNAGVSGYGRLLGGQRQWLPSAVFCSSGFRGRHLPTAPERYSAAEYSGIHAESGTVCKQWGGR